MRKLLGEIIQTKYIGNNHYVILTDEPISTDLWSTEEHERYRVFIKDYTIGTDYIYAYRRTNNLLEAQIIFKELNKNKL